MEYRYQDMISPIEDLIKIFFMYKILRLMFHLRDPRIAYVFMNKESISKLNNTNYARRYFLGI